MGRLDEYKKVEKYVYQHQENPKKWRITPAAKAPDGEWKHRQKTITGSLTDAIRERERIRAEIRGETDDQNSLPRSLMASLAEEWRAEKVDAGKWSDRTHHENRRTLKDHILPEIGHIVADDLTREDIKGWKRTMKTKTYERGEGEVYYSQDSLRRYWAVLKDLVKFVYLEGYLDRRFWDWVCDQNAPTSKADPDDTRREDRTVTLAELFKLLGKVHEMAERETDPKHDPESISERWYPHAVTIAWTGMRFGETAGLEWRDIDFDRRIIFVRRSFSQGRLGPPKGGKRKIAMAEDVAEALHRQRQLLVAEQNVGFLDDGIVFPSDVGGRRWSSSIHSPLQDAAEAAGIDVRVGPQVLRKTLATVLDELDVSVKGVQKQLGHKTLDMAEHYDEKREEQMVRTIDAAHAKAVKKYG